MTEGLIIKSLERAQKNKAYPLKFNGEMFYLWKIEGSKSYTELLAKEARINGYNARIVDKINFYEIYIRRK